MQVVLLAEKEKCLALEVSGLKSGGSILEKATIKWIMDHSIRKKAVQGSSDVWIFREVNKFQVINLKIK